MRVSASEGIGPVFGTRRQRFERHLLPHMDAAYSLALWLMRQQEDAEDAVQEAYLRAYKGFARFDGRNPRAWLLTIVRNVCYRLMRLRQRHQSVVVFDDTLDGTLLGGDGTVVPASWVTRPSTPEELAAGRAEEAHLVALIGELAPALREVLVLRELEDLAYREIAEITGVPIGTVMSRLSRARRKLAERLLAEGDGRRRDEV